MNIIKERWIAVQGSVFTDRAFPGAGPTGNPFKEPVRAAVAFNVGDEVARHIADSHNATLGPGVKTD